MKPKGEVLDPDLRRRLPRWRKYVYFMVSVVRDSRRDELPLLAAALAYFALLSLIPLLLLTASVVGIVFKQEDRLQRAIELIIQYLPVASDTVTSVFTRLVLERGTVGGVGLLALVWICLRMFVTLQRALDQIWDIDHHEKRAFYLQVLIALPTMTFLGIIAWLSCIVTSVVGSLSLTWPDQLRHLGVPMPDLVTVVGHIMSALLSIAIMFLIYRLLPSARVRSTSAMYGALTAGTLWELAKQGFTWFFTHYSHLDQFYGAMGGLVIVMLWSFISALIVLFGAEVVACHAQWIAARPLVVEPPDEPAREPGEPEPSPELIEDAE